MSRFAVLCFVSACFVSACFVSACVGTANSKCDNCVDHVNEKCNLTSCDATQGSGEREVAGSLDKEQSNQSDLDITNTKKNNKGETNQNGLKVGEENAGSGSCDSSIECEKPTHEDLDQLSGKELSLDSSKAESSEVLLVITPPKNISESTLREWRQKTECLSCSERKKIDVLTVNALAGDHGNYWKKIVDLIDDTYGSSISLQIMIFPAVHESFLAVLGDMLNDVKGIQRVIFLDPGATDGLNGVLSFNHAASIFKKLPDMDTNSPSLEVLALNTGRSFEKDRRRILAGSVNFFYVELSVSETLGSLYLFDWFLDSRLGINGPLAYGKASKADITKIRKLTPAAWFQRTSGSKTEDVSDDTLTLMLP